MSPKISTGSIVKLRLNGNEKEYKIVDPQDINPGAGHISWSSPIASAIMGSTAGCNVVAELPSGKVSLEVLEVL